MLAKSRFFIEGGGDRFGRERSLRVARECDSDAGKMPRCCGRGPLRKDPKRRGNLTRRSRCRDVGSPADAIRQAPAADRGEIELRGATLAESSWKLAFETSTARHSNHDGFELRTCAQFVADSHRGCRARRRWSCAGSQSAVRGKTQRRCGKRHVERRHNELAASFLGDVRRGGLARHPKKGIARTPSAAAGQLVCVPTRRHASGLKAPPTSARCVTTRVETRSDGARATTCSTRRGCVRRILGCARAR